MAGELTWCCTSISFVY